MRQTSEGSWDAATEQVDWNKIDATSDAEIERQEVADLVEAVLQRQVGGLVALAEHLHFSLHQSGACGKRSVAEGFS